MTLPDLQAHVMDYVIQDQQKHYRLAYSYVKSEADALDVLQEAILKAMTSYKDLKNPSHVKTWFYRILVNTALDFLRKRKRLVPMDDIVSNAPPLVQMDRYENIDLKVAMDRLPPHYRSVILLRYFEDLKIETVAEILDKNVNTVKGWLYKALEQLHLSLKDMEDFSHES